jgi:CAAX prenyl protease-like protein
MFFRNFFSGSPIMPRVAPFVFFVLLTGLQGKLGAASAYWIYLAKTLIGLWLIFEMRPFVKEMRWAISWEAVAVGIGVFALWIGISGEWTTQDTLWAKLGVSHPAENPAPVSNWDPQIQFGGFTSTAWFLMIVHILGMTFIVPPLEEVFYRSFLYRYVASPDFLSVPLNKYLPLPFFATILVFGFSHNEWLAGILCGAAYQWLVFRKNRLGDAMTAHAITNFLLGAWVVWKHAWHFW